MAAIHPSTERQAGLPRLEAAAARPLTVIVARLCAAHTGGRQGSGGGTDGGMAS